jgi:hypothetical protein
MQFEGDAMTGHDLTVRPSTSGPTTDLAESLDVRLMLAGRLSRVRIPLRHDRAELATVLGGVQEPRPDRASDNDRGAGDRGSA